MKSIRNGLFIERKIANVCLRVVVSVVLNSVVVDSVVVLELSVVLHGGDAVVVVFDEEQFTFSS